MPSSSNICRRVFDSSFPDGPIWRIAPDGDFDNFYSATALNFEVMRTKAAAIQWLRNALKTDCLSDLEIEMGIIPDTSFTDAERRAYLRAMMGEKCVLPSYVQLENKLRAAGFDVRVYPNDPTVEPATIIAAHSGYYLVNGDVLDYQERDYIVTFCDDDGTEFVDDRGSTFCGDDGTEPLVDRGDTFDEFDGMLRYPYDYKSPTRYRWPYVFWIAAGKTGAETFADWNMEYSTLEEWTAGNDANLDKTYDWKSTGIRSIQVMATVGWSGSIGPYAQQMLGTIITAARTITVRCMASAGVRAAMVVCDKDGVWDTAGIVESATSSTGETLTYVAANGISGVRLYVHEGTHVPVVGDVARFDQLQIDNLVFTVASISDKWRAKFEKIVLRYKPMSTWAGVLINWTPATPTPGPMEEDD
jgi:hypothetical protein